MGNELFSNYVIEKTPFLTGGHLNLWKIYKATHKERKTPSCVFVFEKKTLESYPQGEREDLLNLLRKEATSLIKFKHPNFLSVIEPLNEDKYSLGFITENIEYSLTSWASRYRPSKIEIKMIIGDLCKGLTFLNSTCHTAHLNLNPNTIFINSDNRVKIAGMNFTKELSGDNDECKLEQYSEILNQNLSYVPPEIAYKGIFNENSDTFAIGCLIYYLLNQKGNNLIEIYKQSVDNYKRGYQEIDSKVSQLNIENKDDRDIIKSSLERNELKRPNIKQLLEMEWFSDCKLKAVSFIETLPTNDIVKNYEFLKQLPSMLSLFENKIIINRILPSLLNGLKVESLINPILPAVFAICDILPDSEVNFEDKIWPKLRELFKVNIIPAASLYFLLSKMTFIGEKIKPSEFSEHCLPIICKAMDCGVSKIQGVVVDNLSYVSNNIDADIFSAKIYPRSIQILLHTNSDKLKKRLLCSIKNLYNLLDSNMINNVLINDLEKLLSKDKSLCVCDGIEMIFEEIVDSVSVDAIRKKIVPTLISILVEGNINEKLYERVSVLINKYIEKIKQIREKDINKNNTEDIEEKEDNDKKKIPKADNNTFDNESFLMSFFGDGQSEMIIGSPEATKTTTLNSTGSESNTDLIEEMKKGDFFEGLLNKKSNQKTFTKSISKESKSPISVKTTKEKKISVFDNLLNDDEEENDLEDLKKKEVKPIKPKVSKSTAELTDKTEKKKSGWDSNEDEDDDEYSFPIVSKRGKNKEIFNSPKMDIKPIIKESKKEEKKESLFSKSIIKPNAVKQSAKPSIQKVKKADIDLDALLNF